MHILHCDLDAFFASVEQRDHPELKGKPVVIGAPPNSRGVVSTCSYEARQYGIRSAMPSSQAYRLCPQAVFLPPDMKRYQEESRKVFNILAEYTPVIEALSIDEAFLDLSGSHSIWGSSMAIGHHIRHRVKSELGLNISVGISTNKFLAKLATNLCKPDGIMEFTDQMVVDLLPTLSVDNLWGIGSVSAQRLNHSGIYTVQDLLDAPEQLITSLLGATQVYFGLSQGIDNRPVTPLKKPSLLAMRLLFQNVSDSLASSRYAEVIREWLTAPQGSTQSHTITVKLRTPDFHTLAAVNLPNCCE